MRQRHFRLNCINPLKQKNLRLVSPARYSHPKDLKNLKPDGAASLAGFLPDFANIANYLLSCHTCERIFFKSVKARITCFALKSSLFFKVWFYRVPHSIR